MKKLLLILLCLPFIGFGQTIVDTTIVRVHDHTDMTWYGNYDEWGVLPDSTNDYRKIYLHYTMGCATGGCSDWDYTTQIFVRHKTGQLDSSFNEIIENYELARVITPYGSMLANNWEFTTTFDVTDFIQVLRDSVEIRCNYLGWSSGFSATLDFEFIAGTPARDVEKVENIYSGGFSYNSSTDFENTKLIPKKFLIDTNSTNAMIKMTSTGHGFDNNQSAAEFKPIDYFVKIDGMQTHTQYNWDGDCGENPIYPQGGTWIYDRANWCPGKRAQAFDHEITPYITPGDSLEVNVDFQSYSWSGTQTPSYIIECQLFQYSDANFSNSAEIIDIIKPSLKDEYSRKNPICGKPLIEIRNYGSAPLTTLEIEYKVVGGGLNTYNWTGNLEFLETEEVELPNLTNWSGNANVFEVTLKNPNGQADDYEENKSMQSEFELVAEYPESFALWFETNGGVVNTVTQVSESSWEFFDENGTSVHASSDLISNTQFRDTLTFLPGCYTFVVSDTDEDGLDFWANNDGTGMVRFREIGATWLKLFNADFGTNIVHQFIVADHIGCTDPLACNYDTIATISDGSCNYPTTSTDNQLACDTYTWNGINYTFSGTYTYTTTNSVGCDSTATLNLTINNSISSTDVQEHCDTYTWVDGNVYTSSNNTATYMYTTVDGCDSLLTLDLTINSTDSPTSVLHACDSLVWNGSTYTATGIYIFDTITSSGCDSIAALYLTIDTSISSIDVQEHCDTYTWVDGNVYTSSNNTATFMFATVDGCDSLVTLNLTINNSTNSSTSITFCDEYTWNGINYTSSGTYTYPSTNSVGCDSTATLNLTINNSSSSTDVQEHCDTYTWVDGNVYTSSNNTATYMFTTVDGCDSLSTLDLTINNSSSSTDVQEHCDTYTWVDGNVYTSSNNTATMLYTNAIGCDSTVTLDLTLNLSPTTPPILGNTLVAVSSLETYLVSQVIGSTYNWGITSNGGAIASGLPTNSIQVQWSSNVSTYELYVIETDINGCIGDTIFLEVTLNNSTVISNMKINRLAIYPNPSRDVFNITFTSESIQDLRVRILNVVGELIISEDLDQFIGEYTKKINLKENAKGIYFLEIKTNDGVVNKKLILQ